MTEFEPGPWILGGCSGRMITTPSGYVGDGFIADVDTPANARLTAAAPEMYDLIAAFGDAITDMFEQLTRGAWVDGHGHKVVMNAQMIALKPCVTKAIELRAAIAKAKPSS